MFTVEQIIAEHFPSFKKNRLFYTLFTSVLRKMLHEKAFLEFADEFPHVQGIELVEQVLDYFDFRYSISDRERDNIPIAGKVVIVANHPIGSLDGLALLQLVHTVRSDVKIVANDLLMSLAPLRSYLLPVKNMTGGSKKHHIQRINAALDSGSAVIFFPAGEVSRIQLNGIQDGRWHQGFMKIAERAKAPILPIHIRAYNSTLFYLTSLVAKSLSTLMLVGQMFHQRRKQIRITIGSTISYETYSRLALEKEEKTQLLKKHLYRLGAGKKPLFPTETAIARPERRIDLKNDLSHREVLGKTLDGKLIVLLEETEFSPILREIGRLRELSFRAIGEGTGKRRDLDRFDTYYQHLVLWDEEQLEIAGAYRFVDAEDIIKNKGVTGLYSSSLFNLEDVTFPFLKNGIELGRSFVQPRYWGKRSLDYLWHGIGSFLAKKKEYRYLFGPVSMTNSMPHTAKELLISIHSIVGTLSGSL